jgi:NAD+ diphosphatase
MIPAGPRLIRTTTLFSLSLQRSAAYRNNRQIHSLARSLLTRPSLPGTTRHTTTRMTTVNQPQTSTAPGHPGAPGYFPSFSTVNFYAGNQVNRMSWLRNDSKFLNAALTSPRTKFILLQKLNPLVHCGEGKDNGKLATLSWQQVEPTIRESLKLSHNDTSTKTTDILGPEANGLPNLAGSGDIQGADDKKFAKITEGLVPTTLALVFLGVHEGELNENSLPGDLASTDNSSNAPAGTPYFALSLTYRGPHSAGQSDTDLPTQRLERELLRDGQYDFVDTRTLAQAGTWELHDAAVVAQARSLIDWNERHQVRSSAFPRIGSMANVLVALLPVLPGL